jgi:hypothetical protein
VQALVAGDKVLHSAAASCLPVFQIPNIRAGPSTEKQPAGDAIDPMSQASHNKTQYSTNQPIASSFQMSVMSQNYSRVCFNPLSIQSNRSTVYSLLCVHNVEQYSTNANTMQTPPAKCLYRL